MLRTYEVTFEFGGFGKHFEGTEPSKPPPMHKNYACNDFVYDVCNANCFCTTYNYYYTVWKYKWNVHHHLHMGSWHVFLSALIFAYCIDKFIVILFYTLFKKKLIQWRKQRVKLALIIVIMRFRYASIYNIITYCIVASRWFLFLFLIGRRRTGGAVFFYKGLRFLCSIETSVLNF